MNKGPASALTGVPYPKCAKQCLGFEHLGASECSAVCPSKFLEETVARGMEQLTDEQRLVIISNYCHGCGGHLPCHCTNDE